MPTTQYRDFGIKKDEVGHKRAQLGAGILTNFRLTDDVFEERQGLPTVSSGNAIRDRLRFLRTNLSDVFGCCRCQLRTLGGCWGRHHHTVNHMDHSVRRIDVRRHESRTVDCRRPVLHHRGQHPSLNCLQFFTPQYLIGKNSAGDHMELQDRDQFFFVL